MDEPIKLNPWLRPYESILSTLYSNSLLVLLVLIMNRKQKVCLIQTDVPKIYIVTQNFPFLSLLINKKTGFSAILLDGGTIGGKSGALFDRRIAKYSLDLLKNRLSHIPPQDFYPLMHERRKDYDAVALPKTIRERDTEYQFYRLLWFQRLLHVS